MHHVCTQTAHTCTCDFEKFKQNLLEVIMCALLRKIMNQYLICSVTHVQI